MVFNSRYNFHVPLKEESLLYNTLTGSLLKMRGEDCSELANLLCGQRVAFPETGLSEKFFSQLMHGGFLVSNPEREKEIIQERFTHARNESPVVITITTTMDCNLGCYYCYESRSGHHLETEQVADILALAQASLLRRDKKSLHIDWYGGEPMLNLAFLETASSALQDVCQEMGVSFHASIISNGTVWPEDVVDFISRNKIRQVQISLDGLKQNHEKRRHYRKEYSPEAGTSSFEQAVELIDRLLECVRVDVRLNFDRKNMSDVNGLLQMAANRGWFAKPFPAVIQPARLSAFSETSKFMRQWELSIEEYEELRASIRSRLPKNVMVEESEVPDGFPFPRTSVCAALAQDSVVVGADSKLYRCGLQVGEYGREVAELEVSGPAFSLPVIQPEHNDTFQDDAWWQAFNPIELTSCSRCSFLPICWGGCPKKHLEKDQHALDEQSKYWRINLARLIAKRYNQSSQLQYTEADQFREGWEMFDFQN